MSEKAVEPNLRFYAIRLSGPDQLRIAFNERLAPYINSVHKAARGMVRPAAFGQAGAWIFQDEVASLRTLYQFYPAEEQPLVKEAVEVYLKAQLKGFYTPPG